MSDKPANRPKGKESASSFELSDLALNNEQAVNVVGGLATSSSPSPTPTPLPSPSPTPPPPLNPNGMGTGNGGSAG